MSMSHATTENTAETITIMDLMHKPEEKPQAQFKTRGEVLVEENANITKCPSKDSLHPANAKNQLTIGDLHANAVKFIYFLVRQNVLDITEADYRRLGDIYCESKLTNDHLDTFNRILSAATVNPVGTVRLIGDELADRGGNDYFILKIMEKLSQSGVNLEILLSNHGYEYLKDALKETRTYNTVLGYQQARSLYELGNLVKENLVKESEIKELTEKHYKPNLKMISYSVDKESKIPSLTLYTHAPVGLETVEAAAKLYNVEYKDASIEELCKTIDQINLGVAQDIRDNKIHAKSEKAFVDRSLGRGTVSMEYPLVRLMWNRIGRWDGLEEVKLPQLHNGYHLQLVHGHVGPADSYQANMINLDNDIGKCYLGYSQNWEGRFHLLFSQETPAPRLALEITSKSDAREQKMSAPATTESKTTDSAGLSKTTEAKSNPDASVGSVALIHQLGVTVNHLIKTIDEKTEQKIAIEPLTQVALIKAILQPTPGNAKTDDISPDLNNLRMS